MFHLATRKVFLNIDDTSLACSTYPGVAQPQGGR